MPEPALYTNQLRAGTGDAFVVGQSQSLQQGRHERDVMRNLDVQDMKSRAMQQAKAAAQQDALEKEMLKPDAHDVGRFHNYFANDLVNPTIQRIIKINPKAPNARAQHLIEAQNLNNAGLSLKNANADIDAFLQNVETTFPKAYDLAQLDKYITDAALAHVKKTGQIGSDDIKAIGDNAIQQYHNINRSGLYEEFKKGSQTRSREASIELDPTGQNRTSTKVKVNPYIDIIPITNKKGRVVGYDTRFAGERVYQDHINDPRLNRLFQVQKQAQLQNPDVKAQYEADLKETGQISNPAAKQRAYDELEYKYFIEPFMGNKESWAMENMDEKRIRQFREQKSLTESEREAEKSRQIVNVGVRPILKEAVQGGTGNRTGTEYVQQVTLTKDQANKVALDATNTTFFTQNKDGVLTPAKGIVLDQGISPDVNVVHRTYFNKGQGLQWIGKDGKLTWQIPKGILGPGLTRVLTQKGLFAGGEFNQEAVEAAIKVLKSKGYQPAIANSAGKPYKIDSAEDLAHVNVLGAADFFEITPLKQQAEKNKGISLSKNNSTGDMALRIMNLGLPNRLYIPVNSQSPLKGIIQGNLGDQAFTEMLQRGSFAQDEATMNSLIGGVTKKEEKKPVGTTQKKIKL